MSVASDLKIITVICEPNIRTIISMLGDSCQCLIGKEVVMAISKALPVVEIPCVTNGLVAAKMVNYNVVLIGVYMKHFTAAQRVVQANQFLEIYQLMETMEGCHFVLSGDFNAYHTC